MRSPAPVRVALSRAAARRLGDVRLRRLLQIELGKKAVLDREATGPLVDALVQVWVDLTEEHVTVQVRRTGRSLARRELDLSEGPADLSPRLVALVAAEMIRVQLGVETIDPCVSCRPATPTRSGLLDHLGVGAAAVTRLFPGASMPWLAGTRLEVAHDHGRFRQTLRGEWLGGVHDEDSARWFGGGVGAAALLPLPTGKLPAIATLGLDADVAALEVFGANPRHAVVGTLSARLGVDVSAGRDGWLGFRVAPGLVVGDRAGFTLGAALSFSAGPRP